jgi:hypothetical protein
VSRHHRSHWVQWGDRIMPRFTVEPTDLKYRRDACKVCDDLGVTLETIDEERYDVAMPCWSCRKYCETCKQYVRKSGAHQCVVPVPGKQMNE